MLQINKAALQAAIHFMHFSEDMVTNALINSIHGYPVEPRRNQTHLRKNSFISVFFLGGLAYQIFISPLNETKLAIKFNFRGFSTPADDLGLSLHSTSLKYFEKTNDSLRSGWTLAACNKNPSTDSEGQTKVTKIYLVFLQFIDTHK